MIWSCNSSIFLGRFSLASWRSLMLWFTSSYWCFCWMNFHNLITKENKLFFQNFFAVLIGHETYESKSFAFSRVWILNYMCVKDGSVFGKSFSELFISNLTWNSTDKELLSLFIEFSDQCGLWINELSINEMVLMMENLLHRFLTSKCYKTESTRYKGIFDFSKGRKVLQKRFYGWWKEKSESLVQKKVMQHLLNDVFACKPPTKSFPFSSAGSEELEQDWWLTWATEEDMMLSISKNQKKEIKCL